MNYIVCCNASPQNEVMEPRTLLQISSELSSLLVMSCSWPLTFAYLEPLCFVVLLFSEATAADHEHLCDVFGGHRQQCTAIAHGVTKLVADDIFSLVLLLPCFRMMLSNQLVPHLGERKPQPGACHAPPRFSSSPRSALISSPAHGCHLVLGRTQLPAMVRHGESGPAPLPHPACLPALDGLMAWLLHPNHLPALEAPHHHSIQLFALSEPSLWNKLHPCGVQKSLWLVCGFCSPLLFWGGFTTNGGLALHKVLGFAALVVAESSFTPPCC